MQPIYKLLFFLTAWMISLDHSKKKKKRKKKKRKSNKHYLRGHFSTTRSESTIRNKCS
jgi:hypothetical protein